MEVSKSCLHVDAGFAQKTLRELCSWDLERILFSNVTCSIPWYLSKAFDWKGPQALSISDTAMHSPTCALLATGHKTNLHFARPGFPLGIACQQLPSFRETEMLCWLPVWLDYNLHQVEFTCWEGANAPKTNNLNVWCVQQEETQHVSRSIFGSCIHHLIESALTLLNMLLWPCCHTWLHFRK